MYSWCIEVDRMWITVVAMDRKLILLLASCKDGEVAVVC